MICAVPLTQLQRDAISVSPPLESERCAALGRARMANAVKVWAVLREPVWPEGVWDVLCPGAPFPEICVPLRPGHAGASGGGGGRRSAVGRGCDRDVPSDSACPGEGVGPGESVVMGFACGRHADAIAALPAADAVGALVRQLDRVFARPGRPAPATTAFLRGRVFDWAAVPFIAGGYSSPSAAAEPGDRARLAAPHSRRLFFAGEHTSAAVNSCVQGAMATGTRAAKEALAAIEALAVAADVARGSVSAKRGPVTGRPQGDGCSN